MRLNVLTFFRVVLAPRKALLDRGPQTNPLYFDPRFQDPFFLMRMAGILSSQQEGANG